MIDEDIRLAKAKKNRKKRSNESERSPSWGGSAGQSTKKSNIILAVAVVVIAGLGFAYWQFSRANLNEFQLLAESGAARLSAVETTPDKGQRHLASGEFYQYSETIPTSGPHDPNWISPGFYKTPQPPTKMVHALEHGSVVFYYDKPGDAVMATLKEWTELYPDMWEGIVAAPLAGLGETVVLAAWTKSLTLDPFDEPAAAAFVEAYRGRGPENPMR